MKNIKPKTIILFLLITAIGGAVMFGFSGCFGERYKVDYNGQKDSYEGAKDSYRPGEEVELRFRYIATDSDYSFYLDGEKLNPDYSDKEGYIIRFTMPSRDVSLKYSVKNSMIQETQPDSEMLVDYYTAVVGTDGFDSHYELVLSSAQDGKAKLEVINKEPEKEETRVTYLVPYEAVDRCYEVIDSAKMRKWDKIGKDDPIDGAQTVVKFKDNNGSYIRVSTDKMPENGEQSMNRIKTILAEYALPEYKAD